jgi:MarR family transcriptional regulator, lower aerobic nicotinate degradation pathway regulator
MRKADHPIYRRPGHLIRRLHQIAVAIFMSETKDFNITPVQYSALLAVDLHPGIDQTTLVNTIAFDRSTIGSVVRRLESKKWIKRVSGERRSKRLTITPAGREVLREIDATVDRSQKLILAPLTPAEQPVFVGMLERLVKLNNARSRAPLGAATADERPLKSGRKR